VATVATNGDLTATANAGLKTTYKAPPDDGTVDV